MALSSNSPGPGLITRDAGANPAGAAILLERALCLICDEWGKTREEALTWLTDDSEDWTIRERPETSPLPNAFVQVTRTSVITPPT